MHIDQTQSTEFSPHFSAILLQALAPSLEHDVYLDVAGTLSHDHAFWSILLPVACSTGDALVLENRLGALTARLARHFRHVYSLPATVKDAEMTRRVLDTAAIGNVRILPLQDLDLAGLRGLRAVVLFGPWASTSGEALPASLVDRIYSGADEWLAQDGTLVIADNNALSYRRWKWHVARRAVPGRWKVPSLIRQARRQGKQLTCFVNRGELTAPLSPPPEFVPLEAGNEAAGVTVKERILRSRWGKWRWPSYLCLQSRAAPSASLLHEIVRASGVAERVGWIPNEALRVKKLVAGHGSTTVTIVGPEERHDVDVVVRVPNSSTGARLCETNAAALRHLAHTSLAEHVPRLLAAGTHENQAYYTETRCPGVGLEDAGMPPSVALSSACALLLSFHGSDNATSAAPAAESCDEIIDAHFRPLRPLVEPASQSRLDALEAWLKSALTGRSIRLGFTHGDFKLGNLLFSKRRSRPYVIDWDCSRRQSFPLLDYLMLFNYKIAADLGGQLEQAYVDHILPWKLPAAETRIGEQVLATLGLNREEFSALRVLLWFAILRDRYEAFLKFHPAWLTNHLTRILDHMEVEVGRVYWSWQ